MTVQFIRDAIEYDALSTLLEEADLHVLEAGEIITESAGTSEPPFTHYFRLNHVIKGHVHLITHGVNYQINEGHMLFLLPQQMQTIDNDEETKHVMFINFEIRNLDKREEFIRLMEKISPSHILKDNHNNLYDTFRLILEENKLRQNGYALSINNLFQHLVIEMTRFTVKEAVEGELSSHASHSLSLYNEAVQYIGRHISETIRISELAFHLSISEIYLYKIFMEHANCSPKEYIIRYRMILARSYLEHSDAPVKTISDSLGYPNPNYFSSAFKKETGISPAEYRKQKQ